MTKKKSIQNTRTTDCTVKEESAMKTPKTLEQILTPRERDYSRMINALQGVATKIMSKGRFPEQVVLAGIAKAPFEGPTRLKFAKEKPSEGIFFVEDEVVMAYGPNPEKGEGDMPFVLKVHCLPKPKVVLKKEYTDEQMRQKLARYLEGPFKGHDALIASIAKEVSLLEKPFGIVFFHIYTDVAKALAVPAPRQGDATPTATNYGGPGHSKAGFVPEDGVYLHLVYDDEPKQVRHHFRLVLPETIRPEAGTMLRVKPFCYGVQQKDE